MQEKRVHKEKARKSAESLVKVDSADDFRYEGRQEQGSDEIKSPEKKHNA